MTEQPPYLRIVAHLQRQIVDGELGVGDRVPSTRSIVRDWGVAMATASKALSVLRQEGWVHPVPGSGTVVAERPVRERQRRNGNPGQGEPALSRQRLVHAAIALADAEGRSAVSMRRLAAELGVGPMSLYRHIPDKEELFRLMADTAFGAERPPEPGPEGWRAKLELLARLQWRAYRRHPWAATTLLNSLIRPPIVRSGLRHLDWALRALRETGLDERRKLFIVVSLNGYVGGIAVSNALEVEHELATGVSGQQRQDADLALLNQLIHSGQFPDLVAMAEQAGDLDDLDELFEFGLQRHLDGIQAMITRS